MVSANGRECDIYLLCLFLVSGCESDGGVYLLKSWRFNAKPACFLGTWILRPLDLGYMMANPKRNMEQAPNLKSRTWSFQLPLKARA
ncbi:hypothetical protein B0T21DRAFT_24353 [Apiosordaria backusii]|uniref:Secreted protein n=1 Tax=Apiosordaria backusii TaxID=314023 RepID=A0AA40K773_9PEZI|nr:hypothetical protein B0T21DRAFT_24353 [Apiosordaria backusii]